MPQSASSICRQPGCSQRTNSSYCELHADNNASCGTEKHRYQRRVESQLFSLYKKAAWKRTREFFSRDPICDLAIVCDGKALSTDVDHVIRAELYIASHHGDHAYFFDPANLQDICHACHSHKTSLEDKGLWTGRKHS